MKGLSEAQRRALSLIACEPMKRGLFSGWGPLRSGHGANRIQIAEATANKLISLGLVEVWEIEDDHANSTIRITAAGRAALAEEVKDG